MVVTSLDDSAAKQISGAKHNRSARPCLIPGRPSSKLEDTMMRIHGYILSLLMLCGIASGSVAMEASTLPAGIHPSSCITKVAHRNRVKKHKKPSRPKHRKSQRPLVGRRQQ
jgi:hypothetical protein